MALVTRCLNECCHAAQMSGVSRRESLGFGALASMTNNQDDSNNPAKAAYDAAKQFAREGKFAEALERHEWFHHHALEHHPAYYGVRLSFALGAWKELGEKYPPAFESLRGVRDQGVARLRAGGASDEVFHDVVSINHTLGDDAASVRLFHEVEASDPASAKRRFRCFKEVVLEHAPDVFLRHTPDLATYLQEQWRFHSELKESRARLPRMDSRMTEALSRAAERQEEQFYGLCNRLIELATTAGRPEQAAAMEQLVRQWKSPESADSEA